MADEDGDGTPSVPSPFIEADDVATYGFDVDAAGSVVEKLCVVASALVRADFPGIDDRIAAGTLDADIVAWVVASMVGRVLAAPDDGSTRDSERIGDWSGTKSFRYGKGMRITPEERARLAGRSSGSGAFTITLASSIEDD